MLTKEQFNLTVSQNLIKYRKYHGLTQAALAEKLNYSDKAVSKWERAESTPDITVLAQIAELFSVTALNCCPISLNCAKRVRTVK